MLWSYIAINVKVIIPYNIYNNNNVKVINVLIPLSFNLKMTNYIVCVFSHNKMEYANSSHGLHTS